MTALKKMPKFKNEEDEREFWSDHDATDYVDFSGAREALFPNLKPTTRTISVRLPETLIDKLKTLKVGDARSAGTTIGSWSE